jgi:diguanylate cyclase (GGDEF)-like protein
MVTPETSGIDLSLYLIQVIGYIILYMLFRYEVIDLRPTAHRATFEMSSDPIIILDDEYCIISWNDAFSKCHDINPVYRQNIDDYFENKDVAEAIHSGITFGFSYRNKQYILETIPLSPENENKRGFIIKFNDMTSYIERIETLSYEASHDELTNIFNRRAFVERAQKYILENAEKHEPFSLAMIDIDNFKDINDNFGHVAGDCILEELSAFITKELPMGALFARYGGEEFVILFPNLDDEISFDLAEHVRLMTANHLFTAGNQKTHIYISLGVCHARTGNETLLRDLINKSDEAMYLSKKAGKNQVTSIR